MKRLSLVSSVLIILLVVGAGTFYYLNNDSSLSLYSNGKISFNFPNKYNLDSNVVGNADMSKYFVTAIDAPDNYSSIVIYQIPVASNLTIPRNIMTAMQSSSSLNSSNSANMMAGMQSSSSSNPGNSANMMNMLKNISMMKNITVNAINDTNSTTVIMDNVQLFLNQLQSSDGNFTNITKNDYIYYVLNSSYANNSNGSTQPLTINDTIIVKSGYPNFYVIEYRSLDNSTDAANAYSKIINTFNIAEGPNSASKTWLFKTGGAILSAPVIANNLAYFGSADGKFYAINLDDGAQVWNYNTQGNITAHENNNTLGNISTQGNNNTHGNITTSPILSGDNVYFGSIDSYFYALNKKNGYNVWKYRTGNSIESSPAFDSGILYFGSNDQRLYALNATNGALKWQFITENAVKSSPAVYNGTVYFGSDDGKVYAVNESNGAQVWAYDTGNAVRSSPAIDNGVLYIGTDNGNFYALNTNDGSVKWSHDFNDSVRSSALLDPNDNSLFVGANNGNITSLDMRDGTLKWSVNTGNVESTPALKGDDIVVGSDSGTVYFLNKFSGTQDWSYSPGYYLFNSPFSSPIVYGNEILVGAGDGSMYALDFDKKEGPISVYLYYVSAIVIVVLVALLGVRTVRGRQKKKE